MRITLLGLMLTFSLVAYAWAGDCGGCDTGCGDCQQQKCYSTKCDDPCGARLCRPKCISTDCLTPAGRTEIPVGRGGGKRIDISCCTMGVYELINDCASCYTMCPERGEFELLCDKGCQPCEKCKCGKPKCEFKTCTTGKCSQDTCSKYHKCGDC